MLAYLFGMVAVIAAAFDRGGIVHMLIDSGREAGLKVEGNDAQLTEPSPP
jgi:hypothetical protein